MSKKREGLILSLIRGRAGGGCARFSRRRRGPCSWARKNQPHRHRRCVSRRCWGCHPLLASECQRGWSLKHRQSSSKLVRQRWGLGAPPHGTPPTARAKIRHQHRAPSSAAQPFGFTFAKAVRAVYTGTSVKCINRRRRITREWIVKFLLALAGCSFSWRRLIDHHFYNFLTECLAPSTVREREREILSLRVC